ncbi:hypothetical protein W02_06360 [Nitrospira sp. KM1]|uniref:hypothetical protein n=1 Tax=Nitrospira sp. KM1 TaxID=1936990 RepID=UPI0013A758A1|nr:hypothetical protein [Nitrospira sp. KM1]BCA53496.1 hypothetical protein W02_06360 [Nitrospira sp. KM1]
MKRHLAVFMSSAVLLMASGAMADQDAQPAPRDPGTAPPGTTAPRQDIPPDPRDPGMVKQPDVIPNPDAVVTPPVVDPGMAVNPDERDGDKGNAPHKLESPPGRKPSHPPDPR